MTSSRAKGHEESFQQALSWGILKNPLYYDQESVLAWLKKMNVCQTQSGSDATFKYETKEQQMKCQMAGIIGEVTLITAVATGIFKNS
jgi:hypothetical protein